MLCRMMTTMMTAMMTTITKKKRGSGASVPVYLNVYDLSQINGYAYWLGLGVYHSGVQVHGVEYAYGAHDHSTSGIFEVEPKRCPGFTFRKSILIGRTDLGRKEVHGLMEKLSKDYVGKTYHLIRRNCNHFCNDVCIQLTGKPIPSWVNRLARLGLLCKCVLPTALNETKIRHVGSEMKISCEMEKQKQKLRSQSTRSESTNATPPPLSVRSSSTASRRQQRFIPPPSSSVSSSSTSAVKV